VQAQVQAQVQVQVQVQDHMIGPKQHPESLVRSSAFFTDALVSERITAQALAVDWH
jgi:hypothetical protein